MSRSILKKLKSGLLVTTASITVFSVASIYYEKQKFYEKYLVPFTHKLDPELAHKLTIFWFKTGLVPRSEHIDTPLLAQQIKHLSFRNPVGIAAGFDKNGEAVSSLERVGFGFVEVGSVTPEPQPGNEKPRVFRLPEDKAIINRYGFNSDGHEVVHERLKKLKEDESVNCVLGVNLGKNKSSNDAVSDYVQGINTFGDVADYFVINVSSPNTPGLRDLQEKEQLKSLLTAVLSARDNLNQSPKPLIFLKLSPDLQQQEKKDIANVVRDKKCKIDGLIISNSTTSRSADLKSLHASETGGLSGLPLKQLSTDLISEMYKLTKGSLPIIGVGGVFNGADAYEKIKAGASLVQIYTSFTYHGPPVVTNMKRELETLVRKDNFGNISDAIGKGPKK